MTKVDYYAQYSVNKEPGNIEFLEFCTSEKPDNTSAGLIL